MTPAAPLTDAPGTVASRCQRRAGGLRSRPGRLRSRRFRRRAALLLLAWLLVPGSALAEGELSSLEGTWYVLIHYTDPSTANPDALRWKDLVWTFRPSGSRLEWTEYPIVVFSDQQGRFERGAAGLSRVLAAWEPTDAQWEYLQKGPRVNPRGSRSKTLRGSDAEGWHSRRPRRSLSASVVQYEERLSIEGLPERPVFTRDDVLGAGAREEAEGRTRYAVEELSGREMRGRYQRDESQRGQFRMRRVGSVRDLEESPGTVTERQRALRREAIDEEPAP